jgi:hypothetical protein
MRSLKAGLIFPFGFLEVGEVADFCVFPVPNVFQLILKMLPIYQWEFHKTFPITPHFLSHIVWPWFNFHVSNLLLQGWGVMGVKGSVGGKEHMKHAFNLGEESIFRLSMFQKLLVMGQSKCLLLERKKRSCGHTRH